MAGNAHADFSLSCIEEQEESFVAGDNPWGYSLMEHPEDLGRVRSGKVPGSVWRWPRVSGLLAKFGRLRWGSLRQSDFGRKFVKSTRLLGSWPDLDHVFTEGAPRFDDDGYYAGPTEWSDKLPEETLIGRRPDGSFATAPAAAWPPELCAALATTLRRACAGPAMAGRGQGVRARGVKRDLQGTVVQWANPDSAGCSAAEAPRVGGAPQAAEDEVPPKVKVFQVVFDDELAANPPSRAKVTQKQLEDLGAGKQIEGLYIGRGGRGGVPRSEWANPHKVTRDVP